VTAENNKAVYNILQADNETRYK